MAANPITVLSDREVFARITEEIKELWNKLEN